MQPALPGMEGLAPPPPPAKLTADRRRTERQRAGIRAGVHPLTYALDGTLRIHPAAKDEERRCGNCRFREVINLGTQHSYPKCIVDRGPYSPSSAIEIGMPPRISRGAGTDVRRWWPGCRDHEFGDNALSPDAARSGPASAYAE